MSNMYCGGHGETLPCRQCAANLQRSLEATWPKLAPQSLSGEDARTRHAWELEIKHHNGPKP